MPFTLLQARLADFADVGTALSTQDWCSCFSRCPDLLSVSPPVLAERLTKLKSLMGVDDDQLVGSVTKAPSLMQHSPTEIADKVGWGLRTYVVGLRSISSSSRHPSMQHVLQACWAQVCLDTVHRPDAAVGFVAARASHQTSRLAHPQLSTEAHLRHLQPPQTLVLVC